MKKNGSKHANESVVKNTDQEDVEHPRLGIFRADFNDLLAVLHRRLGRSVQLHVLLDVFHSPVRSGDNRLHAGPGEPVNFRSAQNQSQQKRRVQNRELRDRRRIGHAHSSAS